MNKRQEVLLNNGHNGFRALLAAEVRVISQEDGEVEYIASDETIDSYKEVIRVDGWKFDQFAKNAPFVDTHDYSSIGKLLGNVVNWRVDSRRRQLIETVRWAKDVAKNTVAQLGWEMLVAGFGPKAVSVGFYPERAVTKFDDKNLWLQQLASLGLKEESGVRAIYLSQQQIELSACILGANPNALQAAQKALAAGVINRREFNFLSAGKTSPQFQVPFNPNPTPENTMSKKLAQIASLFPNTNHSEGGAAHQKATLPPARGLGIDTSGIPLRGLCEAVLRADPKKREWIRSAVMVLCGGAKSYFGAAEKEFAEAMKRSLSTGDGGLGQAVSVIEGLADDIYGLLHAYSAFRTLGVVPLDGGKRKLAAVTGKADAIWLKPASQGTAIPTDASISGNSISPEVSTVGALVEVSAEALSDGKTTFEGALLMALVEGLGYRIDYTCFQGDGVDDITNGEQTGIFVHASVPEVSAAAGNTSVASLGSDDFANLIAGVAASALSHPCRFWIAPDHLPKLLKIHTNGERLLKPPTGPEDDWRIHGFPVTWAAAAPAVDAAATKVAAFGRQDAYTVALRQDFEIAASAASAKWVQNIYLFRAIARAKCLMRDATSLATLKTAAD